MPDPLSLSDSLENLHLKDKDQVQLWELLLGNKSWNDRDKQMIRSAYELAQNLHQGDVYKDQPYIYHLLRVANRVSGYLRLTDAELVAAALLHDSVEDHSADLTGEAHNDPVLHQRQALQAISQRFSPRISQLVAAVTNQADRDESLSQNEKLAAYTAKVKQALSTPEGWVIKFCDWCDNGLGIIHAPQLLSDEKMLYFQHKYGGEVMAEFQKRFNDADVQSYLDDFAKGYVRHQFEVARQRLPSMEDIAEEQRHNRRRHLSDLFKLNED